MYHHLKSSLFILCLLSWTSIACTRGVVSHTHDQPDILQSTPAQAQTPTKPSVPSDVLSYMPLGVFEDGNIVGGNTVKFEAMLNDLQDHSLDTVLFVNNFAARDEPLLNISDQKGMNVFMMPAGDLYRTWWPNTFPATIQTAREAAKPIVDLWSRHPSLKGYIVIDEPSLAETEKVKLMVQAFHEMDPTRPAIINLIGKPRVGPIFNTAKPDVMQIDVYPAGKNNPPCDFTLTGFGYKDEDFVSYTRFVTQSRPPRCASSSGSR